LIVANHESFLDGVLLALFLPDRPLFVVHTWVQESKWLRPFLSFVDFVAVDPLNPMALKKVMKALQGGRSVVIFPEGRLTVTGSLMKVYEGPAYIAAKMQVPVIPVHISGTVYLPWTRLSAPHPKHWFPKIEIHIGGSHQIKIENVRTREFRKSAGLALQNILQESAFLSRSNITLIQSLWFQISMFGTKYIIADDLKRKNWTYGLLRKAIIGLGVLLDKRTSVHESIGILLPNLGVTAALIFGLTARGRIPALLNFSSGVHSMSGAMDLVQANKIITSKAFLEGANLSDLPSLMPSYEWIYLEDLQKRTLKQTLTILTNLFLWRRFEIQKDPEETAVILFTSGSEGIPKGVVHSHRSLLSNVDQIKAVFPFGPEDFFMSALPMFHAFGLTAGTLVPLLTGSRVFFYPSPLHYRVIPELIYEHQMTVLFGTSTFLSNYAKHAHPYDFRTLKYVIAGAEKLAEPVREMWMDKFGIRILEGYGATETAPVLSVNTPLAYRCGTVGKLLPGIDWKLEEVAGVHQGGLLHVTGANLMRGYLLSGQNTIQWTESTYGKGWYNTGDVVDIDAEGFVSIVGRVKRFAKIAGEMVSLDLVEKIAQLADPLANHAVIAVPDSKRGESLILWTDAQEMHREQCLKIIQEHRYSELCLPRRIEIVKQLPYLGSGKLDYKMLHIWAEELNRT
jgi:acyl-[acyl-carrier-protein]-phospholipid O-acyltransferase/long-chain-fatty-acid--[acyl-carrier-protein] ligase